MALDRKDTNWQPMGLGKATRGGAPGAQTRSYAQYGAGTDPYARLVAYIQALPQRQRAAITDELLAQFAVTNPENQMSCTGEALARAFALECAAAGRQDFQPSAAYLYTIAASYLGALQDGDLATVRDGGYVGPWGPNSGFVAIENQADDYAQSIASGNYPTGNIALALHYLTEARIFPTKEVFPNQFGNPVRAEKRYGIQLEEGGLQYMVFPRLREALQGRAIGHYATNDNPDVPMTSGQPFTGTNEHLRDFDTRTVDVAVERGYYPIITLNTDALSIQDDKISYRSGGSVGHVVVVYDRTNEDGVDYYRVFDSWADETRLKTDPGHTARLWRLPVSDLENKVIAFALVTNFVPPPIADENNPIEVPAEQRDRLRGG